MRVLLRNAEPVIVSERSQSRRSRGTKDGGLFHFKRSDRRDSHASGRNQNSRPKEKILLFPETTHTALTACPAWINITGFTDMNIFD